jgi:hypothetical protein
MAMASFVEVTDHKHHWAASGCYCGAIQCDYRTPRTTTPAAGTTGRTAMAGYKFTRKVRPVVVLTDRCTEATLGPSPYCEVHTGIVELKHA